MNKLFTVFCFLGFSMGTALYAQIQTGSEPLSFRIDHTIFDDDLETNRVPALDMAAVAQEDEERAANGELPFDGRRIPVGWNMQTHGTWFALDNGDMLWKMKVHAPGALSLELFYDDFHLPQGAELHLYNPAHDDYLGAFTSINNSKSGYYSAGMIDGETTIIEYFEPAEVAGEGRIGIQDIGYRYRDLSNLEGRADDCQVDVNCSEGDDWQDEKHGVVRLRISVSGGGLFYCSGSLVNNTALDCTPYVLSAFHCLDDIATSQSELDQLRFFFNFERAECGIDPAPAAQVLVGCTLEARSQNGGGFGSDFVLLLLEDDIPEFFTPYWNGWNLQTSSMSGGGVCIHHPAGDEKKISTSTNNFISTSYVGGGPNAYFRVIWTETENGHGVTEGGSSGSPLFDSNKLIIGTLTGGSSFCNSVQPGGKDSPDWYGKVGYHWDQNTGSQVVDLKDLLDPINTGQTVLLGTYAPCSATSLDEEALADLAVFPNPSSGEITIDLGDHVGEIETVTLFNVVGKVIAQLPANSELLHYDLSDQPAGLYLVTYNFSNRPAHTQKLAVR